MVFPRNNTPIGYQLSNGQAVKIYIIQTEMVIFRNIYDIFLYLGYIFVYIRKCVYTHTYTHICACNNNQ